MDPLLREIRHTPLLWMLVFVPAVLVAARIVPAAHTLLFVLAVLPIVPLAALLSHPTEAVSEKTRCSGRIAECGAWEIRWFGSADVLGDEMGAACD